MLFTFKGWRNYWKQLTGPGVCAYSEAPNADSSGAEGRGVSATCGSGQGPPSNPPACLCRAQGFLVLCPAPWVPGVDLWESVCIKSPYLGRLAIPNWCVSPHVAFKKSVKMLPNLFLPACVVATSFLHLLSEMKQSVCPISCRKVHRSRIVCFALHPQLSDTLKKKL